MSERPEADPKVGELLLGRYRIVRKLGEGGMGAVYEARHELIGRKLAIKTLQPYFAQNRELIERFHREANAATAVGNEHIIEVTDFGTFDDGSPYIVMEYLEGIEFGALLERERSLPIARLVHIIGQVCNALAAAHARGIVHRDMKPENIYLVRRSRDPDFVKVLDFGISKVRASEEDLKGGGLTKTGTALGTPYYMPPEQAQGLRDIDHRADVYALGVILYRALVGQLPFDAETYPALMVKIMTEQPVAPRRLRPEIPLALEQIVLKAMAKDRVERFQSVEELAFALEPFAAIDLPPQVPASQRPLLPQVPASQRPHQQPLPSSTPFVASNLPSTPPPSSSRPVSGAPADSGAAKLAVFAGVALATIGLGAVIWVVSGTRTPAAAPAVPAAATLAPAPAPIAAEPAPAAALVARPQQPQAQAEVRVKILASPAAARIFIGDVEFPNPTDAFRPRSLDPIRVRIEARGYQAVEQLAIFDQDRALVFALERGAGTRRLSTLGDGSERPGAAAAAATAQEGAAPPKPPAPDGPRATPTEPATRPVEDGIYKGPTGKIRDEF